jgi:hypothetical protein
MAEMSATSQTNAEITSSVSGAAAMKLQLGSSQSCDPSQGEDSE